MSKYMRFILVSVVLMFSATCTDDPLGVSDQPIDEAAIAEALSTQASADQDDGVTVDPFRDRLAVRFAIRGALAPNHPITLHLEGVANDKITGGQVAVLLPSFAGMEYAGPNKRPFYPPDTKIPVVARWQLPSMQAGEEWKQAIDIGSVEKGYYHAVVEIDTRGPEDIYVIDKSYQQTWMFIADGGGFLTPVFDATIFPDRIAPQPGPFRARLSARGAASTQMAVAASGSSSPSPPVTLRVEHYDVDYRYRASEGVRIAGQYIRGTQWGSVVSEIVPSSGLVLIPCPAQGEHMEGRAIVPQTAKVEGGYRYIEFWQIDRDDCGNEVHIAWGHRHVYIPWDHINEVTPVLERHFDHYRGQRIKWTVNVGNSGGTYNQLTDRITLGRSYDSKPLAAHEVTHAIHHKAMNGSWVTLWGCGGDDRVTRATSYKCAMKEGLASYGGYYAGSDDMDDWENFQSSGRPRGKVEGYVAALIQDLIDASNEPGDRTTYPPEFVFRVFATCRVPDAKRDDVADFVWCLENRVDEEVHNDHFPGLSAPSRVRHWAGSYEPSDYDADNVRSTWLKNVG